MAHLVRKPTQIDTVAKARIAATISRVCLTPIDADAPDLVRQLADIFRRRAGVGWNTLLSPDTTFLVADALVAFAPDLDPTPPHRSPDDRLRVDLYSSGSTVYQLRSDGEISEVVAWAKSSAVAGTAFDKLVQQYPKDRFLQKRRSWVERE